MFIASQAMSSDKDNFCLTSCIHYKLLLILLGVHNSSWQYTAKICFDLSITLVQQEKELE